MNRIIPPNDGLLGLRLGLTGLTLLLGLMFSLKMILDIADRFWIGAASASIAAIAGLSIACWIFFDRD